MSAPQRRQPAGVIARLLAAPHRFAFFQAVRLLDRWFGRRERGGTEAVLATRLRFRNSLSMSFPASEIAELHAVEAPQLPLDLELLAPAGDALAAVVETSESSREIDRVEITPAFMGFTGVGGALPTFYTEMLAEREIYHRDTAARAFLDVFQHRAVALFYQAWRKHRLPVQFEADRRQHYLPLVLALAGVGQRALRDRLHGDEGGVADDTLAYFSGLLQSRPVSAAAIRQVLSEYFRVPVRVDQFVGRWFTLPPEATTSLGLANASLDGSAVVGERVWQRDLRMRLTIGPMDRTTFRRFLPGGSAALALRELLGLLSGVTLEYEVRLALRAADVTGISLADDGPGVPLGWDSFLVTGEEARDRSDAGYDLLALA